MRRKDEIMLYKTVLVILVAVLLNGCASVEKRVRRRSIDNNLFEQTSMSFDVPQYGANQGVAVDDNYIYTITNVAPDGTYPHNNVLRFKHDGRYIDTHFDVYSNKWQFSSGKVIDGKLYIAVRGSELEVPTTRGDNKVIVISLSDFSVLEDHDVWSKVDGDPRCDAEGVNKHDGAFWVVYGGYSDRSISKIDKYDKDWNYIDSYELSVPGSSSYRYQDIVWVGDYIYVNIHEGEARMNIDIYKWTGSGFTFVKSVSPPPGCHQGMAYHNNKFYFADRGGFKVRIFEAESAKHN